MPPALAADGWQVVLADVADCAPVVEKIRADGGSASGHALDVTDADQWTALVEELRATHGALHGLVNNAGISRRLRFMDTSHEVWRQVLAINLDGPFFGIQACAPLMRDSGGGSIVNISSIAGQIGYFSPSYSTSKWALRGLTKSAAGELAGWGIRVNSVHPGLVETPLLAGADGFVESEGELGGSTQLSAGMFTAAGTSVQKALGIDDTVERFFQHYMDLNQWLLKPGLIRRFCELTAPTLEWLLELGVEVPAQVSTNAHMPGLTRAGVEDVWRAHVPKDQGYGLVQVLDRARKSHDVDAVLHARVEGLLSEDGRVTGVVADGVELRAGAVVVASGGLAQDPALVERWFPDALRAGESMFVVAAPGSRGDHLSFGEQVGASVAGDGWGLLLPTAEFVRYHHWQAGFPPTSRVHVNGEGRRFMDEDASYAVSGGLIDAQGGVAWMVFDEAARTALPDGYADWTPERVTELVGSGHVVTADDLTDLAGRIGVPADRLAATVERWNDQLPLGTDVDFQRDQTLAAKGVTAAPVPIATAPFYATRVLPAELVCTHAGLEIDGSAAVLDQHDRPIPGLYAAGEAGGGVLGNRYVGGGNAVANALTMGRLAGQNAAAFSR